MANRINLGRVVGATGQQGVQGETGQNGADGLTPYISNGTWWIGTTNTNVTAKGNEWFTGNETPTSQGVNGDLYFNTETYDVYKKENGAWSVVANIRGEKGDRGEKGETAISVTIGNVTTGEYDQPASVTNTGTDTDLVLDFVIPQGRAGADGQQGEDGSVIYVGGFKADRVNFTSEPQEQLDNKLNANQGIANAGKILQVDSAGNVVPASSSAENDVIDAYIVNSTPYSYNWLSEEVGGEPLTAVNGKMYVVRTAGIYYGQVYIWNETGYLMIGGGEVPEHSITFGKLDTELQDLINGKLDTDDNITVSEIDEYFENGGE